MILQRLPASPERLHPENRPCELFQARLVKISDFEIKALCEIANLTHG